jgi:signal transduction histidine kinase
MHAADESSDEVVYDAADQLRHDLLTPMTTISARAQLLARDIQRSPLLGEEERTRLLEGVAAIEAAVRAMVAVVDSIGAGGREPS